MGLFDFSALDDPNKAALIMMGLQMMAPKQQKTSFLGNLAEGGMAGAQTYGSVQNQKLLQAKEAAQNRLMGLQGDTAQLALDREKARAQAMMDAFNNGNAAPSAPPVGQNFAGANPDYQAPAQAQQAPPNPRGAMQGMYLNVAKNLASKGFGDDAQKFMDLYLKLDPKFASGVNYDQNGNAYIINETTGQPQALPGMKARDKVVPTNIGGQTIFHSEYSPNPIGVANNTVTPGEALNNSVQQARLKLEGVNTAYNTGFDSKTGGFAPVSPKINQETQGAVQKEAGLYKQGNVQGLPDLEANTAHTIGLVDKLVSHPGMSSVVGAKNVLSGAAPMVVGMNPVAGTDAADFEALRKQVTGTQFLQAYSVLKGAGQISNVEGAKAENAVARMSTSQSEKEFKAAADDFKSVMQSALQRMRQKAGVTTNGGWSIQPVGK